MTKDDAQRRRWTSYEAVKHESNDDSPPARLSPPTTQHLQRLERAQAVEDSRPEDEGASPGLGASEALSDNRGVILNAASTHKPCRESSEPF